MNYKWKIHKGGKGNNVIYNNKIKILRNKLNQRSKRCTFVLKMINCCLNKLKRTQINRKLPEFMGWKTLIELKC